MCDYETKWLFFGWHTKNLILSINLILFCSLIVAVHLLEKPWRPQFKDNINSTAEHCAIDWQTRIQQPHDSIATMIKCICSLTLFIVWHKITQHLNHRNGKTVTRNRSSFIRFLFEAFLKCHWNDIRSKDCLFGVSKLLNLMLLNDGHEFDQSFSKKQWKKKHRSVQVCIMMHGDWLCKPPTVISISKR